VGDLHNRCEPVFNLAYFKPTVLESGKDLFFNGSEDHLRFGIIENDTDLLRKLGKAGIGGYIFSPYRNGPLFFPPIFMVKDTGSGQAKGGFSGPRRTGNQYASPFR